jgi:uncharacterized protein YbaP (TraB family)
MKRLTLLAFCLLLLLSKDGFAQSGDKLFMWKATAKNGATVYLLGSIHLASSRLYPLPAPMEKAFKQSSCLVVEADPDKVDAGAMQQLVMQYGVYPPGDSIAAHVSPSTDALLKQYMQSSGPAPLPLEQLKPWAAASIIMETELGKHGMDPRQGIDLHFIQEAKAAGKRIDELETPDFQLKLMASFPDKLQDAFLLQTLQEISKLNSEFDQMMTAWQHGSAADMSRIVLDDASHPELAPLDYELLTKRNVTMDAVIEQRYLGKPGSAFVVVGSGHLLGDQGILALLSRHGFTVQQMSR